MAENDFEDMLPLWWLQKISQMPEQWIEEFQALASRGQMSRRLVTEGIGLWVVCSPRKGQVDLGSFPALEQNQQFHPGVALLIKAIFPIDMSKYSAKL